MMMKYLKLSKNMKKKVNASEEDRQAIRYLRQRIYINNEQFNLGLIDEDEYEKELKDIAKKVLMLEAKYEKWIYRISISN